MKDILGDVKLLLDPFTFSARADSAKTCSISTIITANEGGDEALGVSRGYAEPLGSQPPPHRTHGV